MSLQKHLIKFTRDFGEVTYDMVENFVENINEIDGKNYKMKTAERVLNPSKTDKIETLKNDKGSIRGYRYITPKTEFSNDQFLKALKTFQLSAFSLPAQTIKSIQQHLKDLKIRHKEEDQIRIKKTIIKLVYG